MAAYLIHESGADITVRYHDSAIRVTVGTAAEVVAFAIAGESPLALTQHRGRVWLTYQSNVGAVLRRYSDDCGRTWTLLT